MQLHERIVRAQHGELVGRGDKRQPGELGDLRGGGFGEAGRGIDPRSDGRPTQRKAIIASTPRASRHRASSTVVAEEKIFEPQARTRASNSGDGKPK
jgi:hypothetical protein